MGKLAVLALLAVTLPLSVHAQAQVKANDQCVPGNYGYDWRTTKAPCDTADESKKCRLNRPCFEEVNGARVALGVCTAEKFCSTRSVRVCDGAECSWRTPLLTETPPGEAPGASPLVQTLQPGESLLESALQRILGSQPEPTSPAIDAAQSKLNDALERLAYSSEEDIAKNYDLYRQADEDLTVAKRLHNNPEPSLRDYLRGVIAPRLTPSDQLPSGDPADVPTSPRDWFNRTGSTFGEPYRVAEISEDGPPIPVQIVTDAARVFEANLRESLNNWVKIGQQEIAETVRNWQATGIPGEYTMPSVPGLQLEQAPRTYTFDSVGGALSCGVFGFGCPEPTFVVRETQYTEADLQRMLQEELNRPVVSFPPVQELPPAVEQPTLPVEPAVPVQPIPAPTRVDPPTPPPMPPAQPTRPTETQPTPQPRVTPTPFVPTPMLPITTPSITSPQLLPFPWLSSVMSLLSSLMQLFNSRQQPNVAAPQQTTHPILTVAAQPPSVGFNERTRIAWASKDWRNSASVTCRVTQVGISLGSGGATGSIISNPIAATSSVTVFCSEPGNTSLQHTIAIPLR